MNVEFLELKRIYESHKEEYDTALQDTLESGWYVLGKQMEAFEEEFASYLGIRHCIAVNSGTDALILAFRALNIGAGDEVIVPANTYIASVIGVTENGAKPVFTDCDDQMLIDAESIEDGITERTKAILPVHLYGQACRMEKIEQIADRHNLKIVEDCAQCHGARSMGRLTGTYGSISCFSFYPTKPLGAFGDAGALVTNDDELAERLRMLRNYGSRKKYHNEINGINSRMDELQAAFLKVGLKHLEEGNAERRKIAEMYLSGIDNKEISLPRIRSDAVPVFHQFPVFTEHRDRLKEHLASLGVKTMIHYPVLPYVADCYKAWGYQRDDFPHANRCSRQELSLPIYAGLTDAEIHYVIECVNAFHGQENG